MESQFRDVYWGAPLTPISEAETIWRYMDLGKLVSMLASKALFFPVVASLGDEFEAARPKLPAGSSDLDRRIALRSWAQWRCICFANCWHLSQDESAAMWKIYAGSHQGIAMKSTFKSLASAFPAGEADDAGQLVQAGLVDYIDPDLEEALPKRLDGNQEVLRKRRWYQYENELRLIFMISGNMDNPSPEVDCPSPRMQGIWASCNLEKIIEGVVIAPRAPPYLEFAVRKVLELYKFNPELVTCSRLDEKIERPCSHCPQ